MKRSRQRRGPEVRAAAGAGEHFYCEIAGKDELVARADPIQEIEGLAITAHQDVLTVIDEVAGFRIGERVGTSPERRFALEQGDTKTKRTKGNSRRQTGESATDHDDVTGFNRHRR